ncbi:THO complex subunit 6 [Nymphaea colorata]|nr:THO complex subunit 6 [Nymphaea colorata]
MGDLTDWDEEGYREAILRERQALTLTLFRSIFPPSRLSSDPDVLVAASSDGSLATYSVASAISGHSMHSNVTDYRLDEFIVSEPQSFIKAHNGPVYDVKFFGDNEDSLLLSCGDDGHIRGWKWKKILNVEAPLSMKGHHLSPSFDLVSPQHRGPWNALSPIPEVNSVATDIQGGRLFAAAGDSCAYCWDVETGTRTMTFTGHKDYLHCVIFRNTTNQIITGSEDGTAKLWDCRSGKCAQTIDPSTSLLTQKGTKRDFSWISCIAIDSSENWLVCGGGDCLSLWSLPSSECILRFETHFPIQDAIFDNNQVLAVGASPLLTRYNIDGKILSQIQCAPQSAFSVSLHPSGIVAVGGYGGLVDIISEFGSHLCAFRCQVI